MERKEAKKPIDIFDRLVDEFYEAEGELERILGLSPAYYEPVRYGLPYFDEEVNDEIYAKFQKVYKDLIELSKEVSEHSQETT